jgi:hypothetical protein
MLRRALHPDAHKFHMFEIARHDRSPYEVEQRNLMACM